MIGKHFIETSNKVELRINRVRINRFWPVLIQSLGVDRVTQFRSFSVALEKLRSSVNLGSEWDLQPQ